jgi:hypothetical protein
MSISPRERRAVVILAGALAVFTLLQFVVFPSDNTTTTSQAVPQNPERLRQRVALLRQSVAVLPAREASLKQIDADLADRERGIIQAETTAQAQAELVETARRVGKTNQIDVRTSDFGAPRVFGEYGIVYANITFDCHVEQLLNFLADLTREPELIVPSEQRIASGNTKEKLMTVRITLAGIVAKKLVPEKKGLAF